MTGSKSLLRKYQRISKIESNMYGRNYTTILICITIAFLFADQNLLSPNLTAIAREFKFSDADRDAKLGGNISFGFFVLGAPAALLVGYLTDSCNRCKLFGLVVILGEAACLGTYWVQTYPQLFACRVLTGISIGGAAPVIFSLLADYWPGSSRVQVSTLIGISMSAGIAFGQLTAGLMGPTYGWRSPFLVVAIPCLLLGILIILTSTEPIRGGQEEEVLMMRRSREQFLIQAERRGSKGSDIIPSKNDDMEEIDTKKGSKKSENVSSVTNPLQPHTSSSAYTAENHIAAPYTAKFSAVNTGDQCNNDLRSAIRQDSQDRQCGAISTLPGKTSINEIHYDEKIDWSKVCSMFSTPTVALIFIQGVPGCLPWGMIYVFLNDYFSQERGMSVETATGALVLFGIGGFLGQAIGGMLGQYLYNRDKRLQCLLMGSSTIIAVFPMLYLINTNNVGDAFFYFVSFVAGIIVSINGPNVRTVLQNVCVPETRGTAFAFFNLADDLGKGAGPVLVVSLIQSCNGHRREAFNIVVIFWIFCGIMLLLIIFTVERDEDAVQRKVRQSIDRQQRSWISNQKIQVIAPRMRTTGESPIIVCLHSDESTIAPYPNCSDLIENDSEMGGIEGETEKKECEKKSKIKSDVGN